jgi:hypothetical protein
LILSEAKAAEVPRRAPIPQRATGTDTVTVACNLPQGIILQMFDVEVVETVLPNGRMIKENVATLNLEHGQHHIRGVVDRNSLAAVGAGDILPDDYRVIRGLTPGTGYALTYDVPRDFWEEWLRRNPDSPLVKGKHIFAAGSESRAVGQAREYKEFKSGFQGLDQGGDYRVPRGGQNVRKFDRTDNRAAPPSADDE